MIETPDSRCRPGGLMDAGKPERVAVLARWEGLSRKTWRHPLQVTLAPVVPREDLHLLRICPLHATLIYFDAPRCPCCGVEAENRALVRGWALARHAAPVEP
jgi:hypothetical protein